MTSPPAPAVTDATPPSSASTTGADHGPPGGRVAASTTLRPPTARLQNSGHSSVLAERDAGSRSAVDASRTADRLRRQPRRPVRPRHGARAGCGTAATHRSAASTDPMDSSVRISTTERPRSGAAAHRDGVRLRLRVLRGHRKHVRYRGSGPASWAPTPNRTGSSTASASRRACAQRSCGASTPPPTSSEVRPLVWAAHVPAHGLPAGRDLPVGSVRAVGAAGPVLGTGQTRSGWVVGACLGYSRAGAGGLVFSKTERP